MEPGYLRKALPGTTRHNPLYNALLIQVPNSACAPDIGEDFETVADDYQKLIMPGGIFLLIIFENRCSYRECRFNTLATSIVLRLFSCRRYIRKYSCRFVLHQYAKSRVYGNETSYASMIKRSDAHNLKWSSSPACTELESIVLDWAAQLLGLNSAFYNSSGIGGGVIQV